MDNTLTDATATAAHEGQRPAWKSVLLVLTCTLAMITNVCDSTLSHESFMNASPLTHYQIASSAAVSVFSPVIGAALDIDEDLLQWLISAFSLSSVRILYIHYPLNVKKPRAASSSSSVASQTCTVAKRCTLRAPCTSPHFLSAAASRRVGMRCSFCADSKA